MIVGSAMREGATVSTHNNTKGLVRAFDVRTGKLLWTFNTIPRPGEFGNDTWEKESWARQRQHRRLDADHRRRRARSGLSAGRNAVVGLLRRPSSRQQSVRRKPGLRRSEDRTAQVALPVRAPSDLELRQLLGAAAPGHQRQRQGDQGGGVAEQAGVALRLRSRDRAAGVADRRAAGAAVRRAGREDVADAAVSDQAAGLRAQLAQGAGRPDRLHAGAARAGARAAEALQGTSRRRSRRRFSATSTVRCTARSSPRPRPTGPARPPIRKRTSSTRRPATSGCRRDRSSRRRRGSRTSATCPGIAGQEFREVMGPGDCCAADAPPRPPQQQPAPPPATNGAGRRTRRRASTCRDCRS